MRLSTFIRNNLESILLEWEDFAQSLGSITSKMDRAALRNHAALILGAVAADMDSPQSAAEQRSKSLGKYTDRPSHPEDAVAKSHGTVRAGEGFTLDQMVSEYRALRASVLRLWAKNKTSRGDVGPTHEDLEDQVRFNEAIDEALTDSIHLYANAVDQMFAAKAKRRMEAMGTLAAGLGHDMANVLIPMRNGLATLVAEGVTPKTAPVVDSLRRAVDHLTGLTKGLRAFVMDPESVAGYPDRTDLHEWWATAISPFTWALPKGVSLHVTGLDAGGSPLPVVRVPSHVLMQAVFNLVQNAAQAHMQRNLDEGMGQDAVAKGNIWIAAHVEEHPQGDPSRPMVCLTVRDDGPGMDESTVIRCTDAFFTTRSKNLGSGLGLYVVRTVLERHGGTLRVESQLGVGTTFTVLLPIAWDDVTVEVPARKAKKGQS